MTFPSISDDEKFVRVVSFAGMTQVSIKPFSSWLPIKTLEGTSQGVQEEAKRFGYQRLDSFLLNNSAIENSSNSVKI